MTASAMVFASPSLSYVSFSSCNLRSQPSILCCFHCHFSLLLAAPKQSFRRLIISSCLEPSNSSDSNKSSSDLQYEIQHELPPPRRTQGSPVYVTLPADAVSASGKITQRKVMLYSLRALALAGVEGVVMEVWWGLVEREGPLKYDWKAYLEIVSLARIFGLKVRAVMAFHQSGVLGDSSRIPLPEWVQQLMDQEPDLAYSDRFGRRNHEYISLGCDCVPVLNGRSPIQTYSDFMRNFRDTFREFLGDTFTGIQVGMGPAGELRYPSCPSRKLAWPWRFHDLGEFQCYDKYMVASLNAHAQNIGRPEWENGGPLGAGNWMHNHEETEFFRSDGSWKTTYGRFFLEWYSAMLLLHGERLCKAAVSIFQGTSVNISAKLAGLHWHYETESHPSELTAGYYNTVTRDGYLPIACMFSRYGVNMCCTCLEMLDNEVKHRNPLSNPEALLRQIMLAARAFDLSFEGENSAARLDDKSLKQVLKMSKFYSDGHDGLLFSFNFVRMDNSLFNSRYWISFTRFVRQMTDGHNLATTQDFGRAELCPRDGAKKIGAAHVYC